MENHLEREEVQAALRRGYGESQRYSGTMTVKMLYSAQRLADGSVLRLSMPQHTMLMVIWDMALPLGVILLVVSVHLWHWRPGKPRKPIRRKQRQCAGNLRQMYLTS